MQPEAAHDETAIQDSETEIIETAIQDSETESESATNSNFEEKESPSMSVTTKPKKESKKASNKEDTSKAPVYPVIKTDQREILRTQQRAVRENVSSPLGYEKFIPLRLITGTENPRQEPRNLANYGYKLVDSEDEEHSLLHMALSADMETVRTVVSLFEEHENDPSGYYDDDQEVPIGETASKSIVGLANQFIKTGQLQPVVFRSVGKGEKVTLIFGQRRTAASIYLAAKSRVDLADGVEGAIRWEPGIRGLIRRVTDDEAYDMAVSENFHREDFTPLQEGAVYARYLGMVNPETGKKKYTLLQLAKNLGVNPGRIRSYAALIKPRDEKKGKGLTDEDREAIEKGDKTVTWGIRKALGEKHYSDGERQTTRAKAIPLKAMQQLFDDTAESNLERRQAIADCMGVSLEDATKQSEERILASDEKDLRKLRKSNSRKNDDSEEFHEEDLHEEIFEDEEIEEVEND